MAAITPAPKPTPRKREKKRKTKSARRLLVEALDKATRDFVLERDGGQCVLCGRKKDIQAGHLFSRVFYPVRWDLRNVWAQCQGCNNVHESNPHIFTLWYIRQFGAEAYEALAVRSKSGEKMKTPVLEGMLATLQRTIPRQHVRRPHGVILQLINLRAREAETEYRRELRRQKEARNNADQD